MNNKINDLMDSTNSFDITRNIFSMFGVTYLFYLINKILFKQVEQPIILIAIIMISVSMTIVLSFYIIQMRIKIGERRKRDELSMLLKDSVFKARKDNNYEDLNNILNHKNSYKVIMQVGYYIHQHFNGSWLEITKLKYPSNWGDCFFENMSKFFNKESVLENELSDPIVISTFLSYVKKDIVQSVVSHFESV